MRIDCFDFDLPAERIALRPAVPRDSARLLIVRPDGTPTLEDRTIRDLPFELQPGDILAVNDTRVLPARLFGSRIRGDASARIEAILIQRIDASGWRAFARPAKKLKLGDLIRFTAPDSFGRETNGLDAEVIAKKGEGEFVLRFAIGGQALDDAIERTGQMPLPPYIAKHRPIDEQDARDYQTLFAQKSGAVAAPTASLHFTPRLLDALGERGVLIQKVTLHVGAGTFLPVKANDTQDHIMHAEWGEVSEESAVAFNRARAAGGRIVAVGTTSLRILETAVRPDGTIGAFRGQTSIFITPGYCFKAVDVLLTNFHLPRSTLFMLAAAFCGLETIQVAYAHAIAEHYRFYSYGDACLLFPGGGETCA